MAQMTRGHSLHLQQHTERGLQPTELLVHIVYSDCTAHIPALTSISMCIECIINWCYPGKRLEVVRGEPLSIKCVVYWAYIWIVRMYVDIERERERLWPDKLARSRTHHEKEREMEERRRLALSRGLPYLLSHSLPPQECACEIIKWVRVMQWSVPNVCTESNVWRVF